MSEKELIDDNNGSESPATVVESKGSVARGIGLILLWHLVQIPIAAGTLFISLALIAVTQLAYVIPAIVIARRKGHDATVKGIIIAASLTALLNIACTGYLFFGLQY